MSINRTSSAKNALQAQNKSSNGALGTTTGLRCSAVMTKLPVGTTMVPPWQDRKGFLQYVVSMQQNRVEIETCIAMIWKEPGPLGSRDQTCALLTSGAWCWCVKHINDSINCLSMTATTTY